METRSARQIHGYSQDAYLPQRLVDKLLYMCNYIEMARMTAAAFIP